MSCSRSLLVWLLLFLCLGGCARSRSWPQISPPLQPGRYLTAVYRSPSLQVGASRWQLRDWQFLEVSGLTVEQAQALFLAELTTALTANGLAVVPTGEADHVLSGTVHHWQVSSPFWRWLAGRGRVVLEVSGEVRQQQELVFAFSDRVVLTPAINPRRQPTLEPELLARLAARRLAADFLNELLLPPEPVQPPAPP